MSFGNRIDWLELFIHLPNLQYDAQKLTTSLKKKSIKVFPQSECYKGNGTKI